ncbi:hypothetical protein MBLNU230_g6216t1 [Neophaeotheca triangularis]
MTSRIASRPSGSRTTTKALNNKAIARHSLPGLATLLGKPSRHHPHSTKQQPSQGPLTGIKILDFSRILAGPFCTQILADYGATVTKIEQPLTGDETRSWQNAGESSAWKQPATGPMSLYFAAVNRNKRSLTLDLKKREALEVVYRLAAEADVVVENFVPGGAERLGVGWEALSQRNPRLVYASISGYGAQGPYAGRAGYDAIAAAEGGLMHITGHPEGGPVRPGLGMTDMSTGLFTHGAIMAALWSRERTGRGQKIDASLFETQLALMINVGASWLNLGVEGKRYGAAHPSIVPYNTWQCMDGVWLALAANNERQFRVLCERIGRPELIGDERFTTNALRVENRVAMDDILDELFGSKTSEEWLKIFDGSGLACGPVNTIQKAFEHPQAMARDMVRPMEWDATSSGQWKSIGVPVKLSDTKGDIRQYPPRLGEHTEHVLSEAGYSTEEIEKLRTAGAI